MPSFDCGLGEFYHEMELYINYRIYDTGFCDLIPDIMAQILNTHIIAIDNAGLIITYKHQIRLSTIVLLKLPSHTLMLAWLPWKRVLLPWWFVW